MIWVWSLESSSQLFTQNLLTQRSQLARAHRGNKVRSGAGSVPALWLQSVCECVCVHAGVYRTFCMGCLHWVNKADPLHCAPSHPALLSCRLFLVPFIAKSDALISVLPPPPVRLFQPEAERRRQTTRARPQMLSQTKRNCFHFSHNVPSTCLMEPVV